MTGNASPLQGAGVVDWSARNRPLPGETESGDAPVVVFFPGGALLGLIDGLGHGPEAATAARAAVARLEAAPDQPVLKLINLCHEALRSTRGAVTWIAGSNGGFGTRVAPPLRRRWITNGVSGASSRAGSSAGRTSAMRTQPV